MIFFDDGDIKAYNKKTGEISFIFNASLKDVAIVDGNSFYLGTNIGVFWGKWNGKSNFEVKKIDNLQYRVNSLAYHPLNKNLYISNMNGLCKMTRNETIEYIHHDNKNIFPNSIVYAKGKIYASTFNNGIYIIDENEDIEVVIPKSEGENLSFSQVIEYQNSFIGNASGGLYQFDFKGNLMRNLQIDFGLASKKTFSFSLFNNELWVGLMVEFKTLTSNTNCLRLKNQF